MNAKSNLANTMKKVITKIFLMLWVCSLSWTSWGKSQHIILTASQGTGSYIFANELSRLWASSAGIIKSQLVIRTEISAENRLTQLTNNRVSLAIIDAKTAHEKLKNLLEYAFYLCSGIIGFIFWGLFRVRIFLSKVLRLY